MRRVVAAILSGLLLGRQVYAAGFADELKAKKTQNAFEALQRYGMALQAGMESFDRHEYSVALGHYAEASRAASALDPVEFASSRSFVPNREALAYEKLGEIDKGMASAAEAKALCAPAKDDMAVECTYMLADLASLHVQAKQSDQAYKLLEKGIPAKPSRVTDPNRVKMVDHVAAMMMARKDWALAGKTLELSVAHAIEMNDKKGAASQAAFASTYFEMFGPPAAAKKMRSTFVDVVTKNFGPDAAKDPEETLCTLVSQQTQRLGTMELKKEDPKLGQREYFLKAMAWAKKMDKGQAWSECGNSIWASYDQSGGDAALAVKAGEETLREQEKPNVSLKKKLGTSMQLLAAYVFHDMLDKGEALEKRIDAQIAAKPLVNPDQQTRYSLAFWDKQKTFLRLAKNEKKEDMALLREAAVTAKSSLDGFVAAQGLQDAQAAGMRIVIMSLGMALKDEAMRNDQLQPMNALPAAVVNEGKRAAGPLNAKLQKYVEQFVAEVQKNDRDLKDSLAKQKAAEEAKRAEEERQRVASQPRQVAPTQAQPTQPAPVVQSSSSSGGSTAATVIVTILLLAAAGLIAAHFIIGAPAEVKGTASLPVSR